MCGLVGIMSSNMNFKHRDCLETLLYLDVLRGRDATGVAVVRQNGSTEVIKSAVPAYEFLEGPLLRNTLKTTDMVWIGHNRFGTVGKNIKANAHPFMVLDENDACMLVGAHNGTLKNKWDFTNHADYGTDSEALLNEIANVGIDEAIGKTEGAWALTYYDHEFDELRFLRNSERTLYYAYIDDKKSVVWASESWMIRAAVSRSGLELFEDKVYVVNENTLYKFPCPMAANEKLSHVTQGGVVGKPAAFFPPPTQKQQQPTRRGGNPYYPNYTQAQPETTPTTGTKATVKTVMLDGQPQIKNTRFTAKSKGGESQALTNKSSSPTASNVVSIDVGKTYKGYRGVPLSLKEIQEDLMNGCSWCASEFILITEKFAWLGVGRPVCVKCLTGTHEDSYIPKTILNLN
jgi:predicted glutamine amidotransferase